MYKKLERAQVIQFQQKYLNGQLERVEELEQEILPPLGLTRKEINGVGYANLPTTAVLW